ncbi:amino acid deaminase [Microbacterium telephonicum]|uniref:Amino acid deaminase n=1 Tax=Microbacterium telephonicum TaxID=1714841 RepID=A0A498CH00_9MICO|nr:amino acid deaminase [Microbacterium telephonicum]RLK52450.1 hypothetical protein C7474_0388 [Microbacterium telephonicum]
MIEQVDAALQRDGAAATLASTPWLGPAIDADAAAGRFGHWARSSVVDENTGAPVLPPAVFAALHARAGIAARWPIGNAGLLHVYGYLLSTTPTPYGLKRERWLDGDLARACGLPDDSFVPWASERTPLERVSAALEILFDRAPLIRERIDGVTGVTALGTAPSPGPAPLGYALEGTAQQNPQRRFVTMFPVADPSAVVHELTTGAPRLRWNAAR